MSALASHPLLAAIAGARERSSPVAVVEGVVSAGHMAPLHLHDSDEALHVLEGTVTLHADGETVRLEAGEEVVVPRGIAHTLRGDSPRARYLVAALAPSAARYEDFLRAVGPPADPAGLPGGPRWATPEDAAGIAAIAGRCGTTVLGPPGLLPAGLGPALAA